MKAVGIIRRVDELGRIVIPTEVRRQFGIGAGTPLEIFTTREGITLQVYDFESRLDIRLKELLTKVEEMSEELGAEKTGTIRKLLKEIQKELKEE